MLDRARRRIGWHAATRREQDCRKQAEQCLHECPRFHRIVEGLPFRQASFMPSASLQSEPASSWKFQATVNDGYRIGQTGLLEKPECHSKPDQHSPCSDRTKCSVRQRNDGPVKFMRRPAQCGRRGSGCVGRPPCQEQRLFQMMSSRLPGLGLSHGCG